MKKLLSILILFPFTFLCQQKEELYLTQNIKALQINNPQWKIQEADIDEQEKLRLIAPIYSNDSTEEYCKPDNIKSASEFIAHYKDVFHFVDIDNDSDVDVIFSGLTCPGIEARVVNIYLNKKKTLKKALSLPGKIVGFTKNNSVIIYNYPCCAMTVNTLSYYRILGDSLEALTGFSYHTYNLSKTKTKIFPSKLKPGKIIPLKYSTVIRMAAIDSVFQNAVGIKSVEIAKTKDGAQVKIYNTYTDKLKQKWLYVKIPYSDIIYDGSVKTNGQKTQLFGWIKEPK